MNKEILQEDKQFLEEEKTSLETRITYLSDTEKAVADKLDRLDKALARRTPNYTPVHKGNKTMYQHLEELKAKWEKEGAEIVVAEKQKIETRLASVEAEIKKVEDELKKEDNLTRR